MRRVVVLPALVHQKPCYNQNLCQDFFRAAKAEGIHTCLDTNGYIRKHSQVIDEVLEATDLVMLDLKHINDECIMILLVSQINVR